MKKYFKNNKCLTCGEKVKFDIITLHNCGEGAAYCKNCGTVYDIDEKMRLKK